MYAQVRTHKGAHKGACHFVGPVLVAGQCVTELHVILAGLVWLGRGN
jgi:hypothetical protein